MYAGDCGHAIFPQILTELAIPTLSIIIDEHSAEAGIQTRLDAFIDLLNFRKQRMHHESDISQKTSELIFENG